MIIIFVSIFFVEAVVILSFLEQAGVLIPDIRTNTLIRFCFGSALLLSVFVLEKLSHFLPKP